MASGWANDMQIYELAEKMIASVPKMQNIKIVQIKRVDSAISEFVANLFFFCMNIPLVRVCASFFGICRKDCSFIALSGDLIK